MALPFVNIFKANQHIAELAAQLTAAQAELQKQQEASAKFPAAIADLEAKNTEHVIAASKFKADLLLAQTDLAAAQAAVTDFDAKVKTESEKRASILAAEIARGQGVPPVAIVPDPAKKEDPKKPLRGRDRMAAATAEQFASDPTFRRN